jgi:hypothetical protein
MSDSVDLLIRGADGRLYYISADDLQKFQVSEAEEPEFIEAFKLDGQIAAVYDDAEAGDSDQEALAAGRSVASGRSFSSARSFTSGRSFMKGRSISFMDIARSVGRSLSRK